MLKYDLIPEQLLYEGTILESNLFAPDPLEESIILKTHDLDYWNRLKEMNLEKIEARRTGFPLSKELIHREIVIMNGTVQASVFAREYGIAINAAGGTHHAYAGKGEGFCLLNDNAIAANYLLSKGIVNKVLIIDLDVHQGNGTAKIFTEEPRVFTLSIHAASNIFSMRENSDLDIDLEDGVGDKEYLKILENTLKRIIDTFQPGHIFYQAGVDVLATDKLGKLNLTREGCKERDRLVLSTCKNKKIALTVSMGGGYSEKIADIVEAHCNTFRLAQEIFF